MRTYNLTPEQKNLASKLFELDQKNLYYIVSQPDERHKNHTIPEIKMNINKALKYYSKDLMSYQYFTGAEKRLFKYVAFIEYPKEFYLALLNSESDITSLYDGVHFHLFIAPTKPSIINMESVAYRIFNQFSYQKIKQNSIRKFSCRKIENLNNEFAEYHTKQHYLFIDSERLLLNL